MFLAKTIAISAFTYYAISDIFKAIVLYVSREQCFSFHLPCYFKHFKCTTKTLKSRFNPSNVLKSRFI